MRIVTAAEMRRLEKLTAENGISYETMMDSAGRAVSHAVEERLAPSDGRIVLLIGAGNNGGDGLTAARYLRLAGFEVACYALKKRASDDLNTNKLTRLGIQLVLADDDPGWSKLVELLTDCSAVVDALLGTGAEGPLRGLMPDLLDQVQKYLAKPEHRIVIRIRLPESTCANRKPIIIAVDLPSGLDADTGTVDEHTLKADLTVTFGYPKFGHVSLPGAGYVGELLVADINLIQSDYDPGVPRMATSDMVAEWLPERSANSHKGTYGSALVVGGSAGYVGAPRLAAEAAYRVGAGLVTLALPAAIYPLVAAQLPEATYLVLADDLGSLTAQATRVLYAHLSKYTALLVGPGLGSELETAAFVKAFFGGNQQVLGFHPDSSSSGFKPVLPPTVIDADGLNLLATTNRWWERLPTNCILTPHPGEMARLCKCDINQVQANRIDMARDKAKTWRCTVVLKGACTVIASPQGQTTIIPFTNPLLAVAGTGDVLAGAIVGLLAQGMPTYQAAICGAYLHGLAGEYKRQEIGEAGLLAHELLPLLALAAKNLRDK
ncbi:MAG: NAD(P)H-hydrate dehydratase [Lysobacterales bacterium]|nr:MAG: NAD(P)H-hydrate dehydratase [Xanthomonadales bacterium]